MESRRKDLTDKYIVIEDDSCQIGNPTLSLPGCVFLAGDAVQEFAWCVFLSKPLKMARNEDLTITVKRHSDCPFGNEPLVLCTKKAIKKELERLVEKKQKSE